jgi:hypothetical protein
MNVCALVFDFHNRYLTVKKWRVDTYSDSCSLVSLCCLPTHNTKSCPTGIRTMRDMLQCTEYHLMHSKPRTR